MQLALCGCCVLLAHPFSAVYRDTRFAHSAEREDLLVAHTDQFAEFNAAWDKYLHEFDGMASLYVMQMKVRLACAFFASFCTSRSRACRLHARFTASCLAPAFLTRRNVRVAVSPSGRVPCTLSLWPDLSNFRASFSSGARARLLWQSASRGSTHTCLLYQPFATTSDSSARAAAT